MSKAKQSEKVRRRRMMYIIIAAVVVLVGAAVAIYGYLEYIRPSGRWARFAELRADPAIFEQYALKPGQRCGNAPFAFPTRGVILGLWDQSYRFGHRHSGIDIFSGTVPGVTPVYAAYPGYLTRLPDWRSTVIIRIPSDPLNPGQQIWIYYTHLANQDGESFVSEEFPQGTFEQYVEAGAFLGYMGDYSGDPGNPTGLHLHVSIVRDEDGEFLNELDINNTYDPSPYFGLPLNHRENRNELPTCIGEATYEPWELRDAGE
jgi:murein DD-endopeptidase MepM/ murein hydrolase activator NlpD